MTRAFIVHITIAESDPSSLEGYKEAVRDACEADGLPVVDVKIWNEPLANEPLDNSGGLGLPPVSGGLF